MLEDLGKTPLQLLKQVKQVSAVHCGPAVLEMLFSAHEVYFSQKEIVEAAGVGDRIYDYGVTVEQLAKACHRLAPKLEFWVKLGTTAYDLNQIIVAQQHPVGIEWQGLFLPEDQDDDSGHYSIITRLSIVDNEVTVFDPYYVKERKVSWLGFQRRWWDRNTIFNEVTRKREILRDDRLIFVVTKTGETFPEQLGMSRLIMSI